MLTLCHMLAFKDEFQKISGIIIRETPKEQLWAGRGAAIGAGLGSIGGSILGSRADTPGVQTGFGVGGLGLGGIAGHQIGKYLGRASDKKNPPKVIAQAVTHPGESIDDDVLHKRVQKLPKVVRAAEHYGPDSLEAMDVYLDEYERLWRKHIAQTRT